MTLNDPNHLNSPTFVHSWSFIDIAGMGEAVVFKFSKYR